MFRRPTPIRTPSLLEPGTLFVYASSLLSFALVSEGAQIQPRIQHEGIGCIVAGRHAIVDAMVEPADDLVTVKVYFRADIYPAFFYVEMTRTGERYQATLPRPNPDIEGVVYYLEAVDRSFNSIRTEEFRPRVVADGADCGDDTPPPAYLDGPAEIAVGATTEGAGFPPGFVSEGIIGIVGAALRSGGAGPGTWIGVGAAAGAAAGAGIIVGGGSDSSTTTAPAVGGSTTVTTTVATTTVSSASPLTACFSTDPTPPTIPIGGTVRFDATCSEPRAEIVAYEWDFHDGREGREGRVISRVYNSPGVFGAELTIVNARGDRASVTKDVRVQEAPAPGPGPGPGPGPTTTVPGTSDRQIVGVSFTPPTPANTNEVYTINYRNNGPDLDPTVTVVISFSASGAGGTPQPVSTPGCGTQSGSGALTVTCFIGSLANGAAGSKAVTVRFPSPVTYFVTASIVGGTTDPSAGNNSVTVTTLVSPLQASRALELGFLNEIQSSAAPGGIQATLVANGAETVVADDRGPRRYVMKSRPGSNVIEGYANGASLEGATWKLDFTGSEGFVAGSLAVESGEVLALSSRSVVLRLSGTETRIRLRFQTEP